MFALQDDFRLSPCSCGPDAKIRLRSNESGIALEDKSGRLVGTLPANCQPGAWPSISRTITNATQRRARCENCPAPREETNECDSPQWTAPPRPPRSICRGSTNAAVEFIDANLAKGRADKTAFIDASGSCTYGELAERVNRAGNALRALGAGMETRVLMCMVDDIDFPAVFWGAIKTGCVPVPINTLLTSNDYAPPAARLAGANRGGERLRCSTGLGRRSRISLMSSTSWSPEARRAATRKRPQGTGAAGQSGGGGSNRRTRPRHRLGGSARCRVTPARPRPYHLR